MRIFLIFIGLVFFFSEAKAQTIVDTIYVRCFQENQNTKYHFL